jgi:hypothetical protein
MFPATRPAIFRCIPALDRQDCVPGIDQYSATAHPTVQEEPIMKPAHIVLASVILTGVLGVSAIAAVPQRSAFEAPTASELGLDASHADAWNQLREESMQLRASARKDTGDRLRQAKDLLAESAPDLRSFSADAERQVDEYLARSRDLRTRKLALYESLSPTEQDAVREAMLARLERAERVRAAFGNLFLEAN